MLNGVKNKGDMLRFECDNCGEIIEDVCGEYVESDDYGNVTSYTCPHCHQTINVEKQ